MLKVNNLSYGFPQKDLYNNISFSLEDGHHCAFIGASGSGKSTLIDILMHPENHMYEGILEIAPNFRIGYVSQFSELDQTKETTVFEFIGEKFLLLQNELTAICTEMETASDHDILMEKYQDTLDAFMSIDGDNFESNINKNLNLANLIKQKDLLVSELSGGEFKLIQVIKEMLSMPDLMIMDEPDVFLDFDNLNALRNLINAHKGILLVVTHNRYLLNHCFNKIIHLENLELQEFDGSYIEYNFSLLQTKIELQELAVADAEEIKRNEILINKLRAIATNNSDSAKGKSLKARVKVQERLEARRIKAPFVDIKQLDIKLEANPEVHNSNVLKSTELDNIAISNDDSTHLSVNPHNHTHSKKTVLEVTDYAISFDELLLEKVSFEIKSTDKVALIGANGTGKTTLIREIFNNNHEAIKINENTTMAYLSQLQGEILTETNTIMEEFIDAGFSTYNKIRAYVLDYGFEGDILNRKISSLSGGERNILQLAKIAANKADLLLLDEPTSHLDTYSQIALEKAINHYTGAILMISHDYYSIANCMDYVLIIENKTLRKMSMRKFRKTIYARHFDRDYLAIEQKKKTVETKIELALKNTDFTTAKVLSEELEALIKLL